jgi:NADH:ubiquinone oxidoreductase subunit 3 (subunit A)
MISASLVNIVYGVVTSLCVLIVLALLMRSVLLVDTVSPSSEQAESFECGYNVSDYTSTDIIDIRVLLSVYLLFDTELWILMLLMPAAMTSTLIVMIIVVVFMVYSSIELYIIL